MKTGVLGLWNIEEFIGTLDEALIQTAEEPIPKSKGNKHVLPLTERVCHGGR